ncbi:RNA polymerase sigma factor [Aquimarina sp. 2201CG14-23]|uniref:RNA polymerase sigma factor n=1 Tax=Aquimarina mycalae TaxID=3040073 RepID=UPI002477DC1E|nr:RNA polymerase sigma factor [Aquimarina sp. 2201CG14-23]MDH7446545.1 RNA polymerase sigma factor [Aquimarina sp. 2201CG14-23]
MTLTKLNTEELVEKCRRRDQGAQMEIYNRYYKAMFNTAYRIIKDSAEAEDVMQEAFLTAFTKLSMLEDSKMFGSWLKRIVINSSLTISRKRNIYGEVPLETVEYALTDETEGVVREDLTSIRANTVLSTLKELKESYSTALSLHLIEGYDYEEICEIMNISYSNCRTLISRAKESLRKKIQVV